MEDGLEPLILLSARGTGMVRQASFCVAGIVTQALHVLGDCVTR